MAEIGVAAGVLSHELLDRREDLTLWMIDSWQAASPESAYRKWCASNGDPNGVRSAETVEEEHLAAIQVANKFAGRVAIFRGSSTEIADLNDTPLDLVFIDADHSQTGCAADIAAWWPKVKPGGWIGGHDIHRFRDDGVGRAVKAFADANRLAIELDDNWTWFIRKAAA